LSVRDGEDVLAQRGIIVSYETIRHGSETFGLAYARLRHRAGSVGDTWHLDELFVTISCNDLQPNGWGLR
jgi:putative transposase